MSTTSASSIIGDSAFENTDLTSIIIEQGVTTIGNSAFANTKLVSVEIPSSVTSIGQLAFSCASTLNEIKFDYPANIISFASDAFANMRVLPPPRIIFYNTPKPLPTTGIYSQSLYPPDAELVADPNPSCYNEGTFILALKNGVEEYVKIEDLRKGDFVKTYLHGYKEIELIGKNKSKNNKDNKVHSMYKINDLIVTGGHFLLVDDLSGNNLSIEKFYKLNLKIDDKYCLLACDCATAERIVDNKFYNVYHLVLKGEQKRYGIYVNNGVLSETTTKEHFIKMYFTLL